MCCNSDEYKEKSGREKKEKMAESLMKKYGNFSVKLSKEKKTKKQKIL